MRSGLLFRDQINILASWFDAWNTCEQTVALYTLFRKLKPGQVKFLRLVLRQTAEECSNIQTLESQANNPAYVSELYSQSKETAMQQLLECLPLLSVGNQAAKAEYLAIIPNIFEHSIKNGCHLDECRQLLSYCLIHPAISAEERGVFSRWLVHLDEKNTETNAQRQASSSGHHANNPQSDAQSLSSDFSSMDNLKLWGPNANIETGFQAMSSCGQATPVGRPITSRPPSAIGEPQIDVNVQRKISRSAPITPPTSNVSDWLNRHQEEMAKLQGSGMGQLHSQHCIVTTSAHELHAPLSPQSSCTSSGSECHDEALPSLNSRNTFLDEGSGMRDVPIWLKSLRLHKYSNIFQQLTYDEMLNLNEDWLESQNVTKGARHKIVLSINKLKERQNQLIQLEKDIMDISNFRRALLEVKSMMNTPIKMPDNANIENDEPLTEVDVSEGDIPGQITRLMGKMFIVCTQLLVTARPDDDCFGMYIQLLDKCIMHEAWTIGQKKKLASWKQQIQKTWSPHAQKFLEKQRKMAYNNVLAQTNIQRMQRALRGQAIGQALTVPKWAFGGVAPGVVSSHMVMPQVNVPLYRNNSFNAALSSRSPLYELQPKQPIGKTHSVPLSKSNVYGVLQNRTGVDVNIMEPEIAARLDSLCLSMTEHAIGNFDSPEKGSTM